MIGFEVRFEDGRAYPVTVTRGIGPAVAAELARLAPSGLLVVTDAHVAPHYLEPLEAALPAAAEAVVLEPGEAGKDLAAVERIYAACRRVDLDRGAVVLALGGGVVGDVAGFAAATWLRGVRVVHLPTTLLSMVDSAIGGKTGVNYGAKNAVGAFHQPAAVIADLDALATLPEREVRSGLGEVWKTGVLAGEALFERLEADADRVRGLDPAALEPVVEACLRHKAAVVVADEREAGLRATLNLGHTLGHALETLEAGRLAHGEAVAVGLAFACRLAATRGWTDAAFTARVTALGGRLGLPVRLPRPRALEELLPLLRRDKKARAGRLRWVLPRGLGRCEVTADVDEAALRAALADLGPVPDA